MKVVLEQVTNPKPFPYVDTMVILDYIRGRNKDSEYLLQTFKRKAIHFCTSAYTLLDLIDHGQEDAWIRKRVGEKESFEDILRHRYPRILDKAELNSVAKQIDKEFLKVFFDTKLVKITYPSNEDSWNSIIEKMYNTNLSIDDAFAIAGSESEECNIFITRDSNLIVIVENITSMIAGTPSEINQKMKEKGFSPFWE